MPQIPSIEHKHGRKPRMTKYHPTFRVKKNPRSLLHDSTVQEEASSREGIDHFHLRNFDLN
jgi:hypothetical protein